MHLSLGQERRACSKTTFHKNIETTVLLSVGTMQNWFVTNTDFFCIISMCLPHMKHIPPAWDVGVLSLMQSSAPNHRVHGDTGEYPAFEIKSSGFKFT